MKKCPICKLRERQEKLPYCKKCFSEYHKKWYKKHSAEEKEKARIYSKKYRKQNKEKCYQYSLKWKNKNPSFLKEYLKQWRKRNNEKVKEYNKKYADKNKEKSKVQRYAYKNLRNKMIRTIGKCQKCGNKNDLQVHHLEYKNNMESVILLCRGCHRKHYHGY